VSLPRVDMEELDFGGIAVLHDGDLFTGVAYENWPDGTVHLEQHYDGGLAEGPRRRYAASGRLLEEVPFSGGQPHGLARWWSDTGTLQREMLYQYGVPTSRKDLDERVRERQAKDGGR
jgi:antitoxin component YwqK of YwqJK toxin-antitoxin module